jgi:pyruvate kinase
MRKAKILATLGPSSNTETIIAAMINAGVSAVRINMSHGTHDDHLANINNAFGGTKGGTAAFGTR